MSYTDDEDPERIEATSRRHALEKRFDALPEARAEALTDLALEIIESGSLEIATGLLDEALEKAKLEARRASSWSRRREALVEAIVNSADMAVAVGLLNQALEPGEKLAAEVRAAGARHAWYLLEKRLLAAAERVPLDDEG